MRVERDLFLVESNERTQDRQPRHVTDRGKILQRLRRHLPDRVARYERMGARRDRQPLGNPHHQPPVHDDPERRRNRDDDLLLKAAERHEIQPRLELRPRENLHQLSRLLLRRARQNRIAVKVHEMRAAASANQPPRRHRRIDAAGQQTS